MAVKIVSVDIRHVTRLKGLADYDAVEILFKNGRDPIGRARISCFEDVLEPEQIYPYCANFKEHVLFKPPARLLPSITVAICTHNRHEELAAALRSLSSQEYHADEILIIDNGCQYEVRDLVAELLPTARYILEPRTGLNFARNCALLNATKEIIAFMDDDAEADSSWVLSMVECYAAFPETAAVTGLILPHDLETDAQLLFEANGGFARGFTRRILPMDSRRPYGFRLWPIVEAIGCGSGCNMTFRTTILKQLGGFDEALDAGSPLPGGGDLDIFYRVLRAGHQLIYEPRALIRHHHRRTKTELRFQLAGHGRSVSAFLVKTLSSERGFEWIKQGMFLGWRIAKNGYRLLRSLAGRDVLPININAHIFVAGLIGLGSYHASKRRIRRQPG
jgi:GT2 family glycosyltransferase